MYYYILTLVSFLQRHDANIAVLESFQNPTVRSVAKLFPLLPDFSIGQPSYEASKIFISECFGTPIKSFITPEHTTVEVIILMTVWCS